MQIDAEPDYYDAANLEKIQKSPLIIAVAGHAEHGKTSVIRTLCRLPAFGEVRDFPGTTKEVSGVEFSIVSKTYMIIFDTPGFQNSNLAIKECGDWFEIEDVCRFFQVRQDFSHDSKALEQVLKSHIVLYVIDVTCPVTEKLQSDFRLLACSKIPVIPLFNFTQNANSEARNAWTDFLSRHAYHLYAQFDAHYYQSKYEQDLYEKIRVNLKHPLHRECFNWYVAWRKTEERNMEQEAVASSGDNAMLCTPPAWTGSDRSF